jgi:hypothetical protein
VRPRTSLRIGTLVIVLIAVVALAAPVALADKWGTARTSGSGSATLRPDDRSGIRGNGPILLSGPVAKTVTVQIDDAFQWGDAGIGAAVAFAAMILAGGIVLAKRSKARPSVA